jgi:branched-chain amino acid transport system ATP-binding protein
VDFLEIQPLRHQQVGFLPHGLQKRVELGRALAAEPSLLLLDEPVARMNQEETGDMVRFILDVKEELGISVVMVEHDMAFVIGISDRIALFDLGRLVAVGSPADIGTDSRVRQAYPAAESFVDQPESLAEPAEPSGFDPLTAGSRVG